MSVHRIARRYASAILQNALAAGMVETVEKDFTHVNDLLNVSADLRALFRSPVIQPSRKKEIIHEIFGKDSIHAVSLDFLELIIEKGRAGYFRDIVTAFRSQLDKQRGIVRADITSAVSIDEATATKLTAAMGKRLGATVIPTFHVNPDLLGGVSVRIGDTVMDSTLRRQLADLQLEMVA